jgi:GTPase SAR1 family protein
LPLIRNHLNSSTIIREIDEFETMTVKSFTLSKTRMLMKDPDYTRKVNLDELESISPDDLISFEIKPAFIKVFPAFKRAIIEHTQNVLNELETTPSVTIYSIETASEYFEEHKNPEEVINICVEGVNRSKAKLKGAGEKNQKFFEAEKEKLRNAIDNLVVSATEITNNESAFQIKLRIVKAKAIGRSKEVREQIKSKIVSFLPKLIESFKKFQAVVILSSQKITKHFIHEKSLGFIATDISDYLSNTQSAIANLPYIYQRLFSFEPLETFELYVERKAVMEKMELAFSKWKEEKFAPVVIIGEKGSGKTTFIRKFIKAKAKNEKVYEINLLTDNKSPSELYKEILEQTHLNKPVSGEKKIIVLDGFERLYESKINGFEFLLKFFKIISDTKKDVFWIVSAHSVSWNFFDKSIEASNYFGYHIYLNDLDFEELYELIETRHKLSGYPLLYSETQKKKSILGNKPIDSPEQQELFMKAYFDELNRTVQGNILQTFIFWMRSASLTENKTIQIESESNLDFNFVRSIPSEKLILLRNILIHSGLDVNRLAKISRADKSHMELQVQQLLDDGILTFSNDVFFVTPLIYKQIIKHLKDINLIH